MNNEGSDLAKAEKPFSLFSTWNPPITPISWGELGEPHAVGENYPLELRLELLRSLDDGGELALNPKSLVDFLLENLGIKAPGVASAKLTMSRGAREIRDFLSDRVNKLPGARPGCLSNECASAECTEA